jgi:hypothetical protein
METVIESNAVRTGLIATLLQRLGKEPPENGQSLNSVKNASR